MAIQCYVSLQVKTALEKIFKSRRTKFIKMIP